MSETTAARNQLIEATRDGFRCGGDAITRVGAAITRVGAAQLQPPCLKAVLRAIVNAKNRFLAARSEHVLRRAIGEHLPRLRRCHEEKRHLRIRLAA